MAERTRVEIRLDKDVYDRLRTLADEAELSLNQILNGVCRWAAGHGHAGGVKFLEVADESVVTTVPEPSRVWFGFGADKDDPVGDPGQVVFELDYSDKSALRSHLDRPANEFNQ